MIAPLVSVHVIAYNQRYYIKETLDSILRQEYDALEIVVADDGSTDGTAEIIQDYAARYPTKIVPLVGGPNLGITGNSQRGLEVCAGKYLAIMGGDDLMLPGKISTQVDFMELHPDCSICYHDMEVFESDEISKSFLFSSIAKPRRGTIAAALRHGAFNCASSTLYRVSSISKRGFRTELPVVSDWMFTIDTLASGGWIEYIPTVLGKYRRHQHNATSALSPLRSKGYSDLLHTCAICLYEHPKYANDIISRLSEIQRESRGLNGGVNYEQLLISSLRLMPSMKSSLGLFVYYVTATRVRL